MPTETSPKKNQAIQQLLLPDHISAHRLLALAYSNAEVSEDEESHIKSCGECRRWWSEHCELSETIRQGHTGSRQIPRWLRDLVFVQRPTLFPNGVVSQHSWQFGRLEEFHAIPKYFEAFRRATDLIAESCTVWLRHTVLEEVPNSRVVLCAFGNVPFACAKAVANDFTARGEATVLAVHVRNFSDPEFCCSETDLRGATVVFFVDVCHSGRLFSMMEASLSRLLGGDRPLNEYRLAIVRQFDQTRTQYPTCFGLWDEPLDKQSPPTQHLLPHPRRFDPEIGRFETQAHGPSWHLIHDTRSLRINARIGQATVLYTVDVPQLLGLDCKNNLDILDTCSNDACQTVRKECKKVFFDLIAGRSRVCIMYRENAATEQIAQFLAERESTPLFPAPQRAVIDLVPLGASAGPPDNLQEYDRVILLDRVLRSGSSLTALWRNVQKWLTAYEIDVAGFVVVSGLQDSWIFPADEDYGFEVRSVIKFPLPAFQSDHSYAAKRETSSRIGELKQAVARCCQSPNCDELVSEFLNRVQSFAKDRAERDPKASAQQVKASALEMEVIGREVFAESADCESRLSAVRELVFMENYSWIANDKFATFFSQLMKRDCRDTDWVLIAFCCWQLKKLADSSSEGCGVGVGAASAKYAKWLEILDRLIRSITVDEGQRGACGEDITWGDILKSLLARLGVSQTQKAKLQKTLWVV